MRAPLPTTGRSGNLQLTPQEEADLVSFLKTLTDGYMRPQVCPHDLSFILKDLPSPPASGSFLEQLKVEKFFQYAARSSSHVPDPSLDATNLLSPPSLNLTNLLLPPRSP